MKLHSSSTVRKRSGLTLLEVIISLAIFLFSMVAIGHLVNLATERALQAQLRQEAAFLCQSKLAEIAAGAEPLAAQSDTPFAADDNWSWSTECTQGDVANLWKVTVTVTRQSKTALSVALSQYVLDPSVRGSTSDPAPTSTVEEETGASGSQTKSQTPSNTNSKSGGSSSSGNGNAGGSKTKGGSGGGPSGPPAGPGPTPMGDSGKGGKQ